MRTTYNWIKQYVDLSGITPSELADALTKAGLEVEGSQQMAYGTNLTIGLVTECYDHPDSDHLHVCKVDTGDGIRQIVCGAPNVAQGQKVIVALPGCVLPGGEIKRGVIRGQESNGMICSLAELGVDKKSLTEQQLAGIEILSDDAPIGCSNVLEYLKLDDTIYDVSLTPNRADCLASWSFAKEVGAILDRQVTLPDYSYEAEYVPATLKLDSNTPKCPLFEGKIINHVTIKPSPSWVVDTLHAAGVKAINNVVDISNLVMLETGQPLHFYDLAKIPAREITVKQGLEEVYTALDGIEYQIKPDDLIITTDGKAIGIGGIMGGDDSKIDENTTGIIIEAATLKNATISNTARRLGLETDAATRFEEGIEPCGGHKAVERSVQLLIELADASGIEETVIYGDNNYEPVSLNASVKQINGLLGTDFSYEDVWEVFARLDFQPEKVNEDEIKTNIPSYRTDISLWQDLAEEVIRLKGYDYIVSSLPLMADVQGGFSSEQKKKRVIQQVLNGNGLSEIISYSLVSASKIEEGILPIGQAVELANPISDERRYYRTSLLPSMLDIISYNYAHNNDEYGLFELANVYTDDGKEHQHLSLALSEKQTISLWQGQTKENDFFTMKGLILTILDKLGYKENRVSFVVGKENSMLHPGQSGDIYLGKTLIGKLGVVHPVCQKKYDIDKCVLAEIDLTAIYGEKPAKVKFNPTAKYPEVAYDLSMIVDETVSAQDVVNLIKKVNGSLLTNVTIFDVYRGINIPKGQKSIAVNLTYQAKDRTLNEDDIKPLVNETIVQLQKKLKAVIRDN